MAKVIRIETWEDQELNELLKIWGTLGYTWNSGMSLESKTPLLGATLFLELEEGKVSYWYSYDRGKNIIGIKDYSVTE